MKQANGLTQANALVNTDIKPEVDIKVRTKKGLDCVQSLFFLVAYKQAYLYACLYAYKQGVPLTSINNRYLVSIDIT